MGLYGNSLASSILAHADQPKAAHVTCECELLVRATFTHTKSGVNLRWCSPAAIFLKLYRMKIIALHRGLNVTDSVIHRTVMPRLTPG
jgi:hypothetical protein